MVLEILKMRLVRDIDGAGRAISTWMGPHSSISPWGQIPGMLQEVLKDANMTSEDLGFYLFHQATYKMLSQLQQVMEVEESKVPILLKDLGNTVSSTLPILINQMRDRGDMTPEMKNLLVGFGVGWSWAGCVWQDIARP